MTQLQSLNQELPINCVKKAFPKFGPKLTSVLGRMNKILEGVTNLNLTLYLK